MNYLRITLSALCGLLLSSCASTMPPEVFSCQPSLSFLRPCPNPGWQLKDGSDLSKEDALFDAGAAYTECREKHDKLIEQVADCQKKAAAVKKKLNSLN